MFGAVFTNRWNWQRLFSYGEVLCFISAWALGIAIATQAEKVETERVTSRSFASANDALGIQAQLRR